MRILKREFEREDTRGKLIQLITGDFKQLNVIEIKKGKTFGGHYHLKKEEFFYVIFGDIRVQINNGYNQSMHYFTAGDCFLVEPFDRHIIEALEEDVMIVEALSEPYSEDDVYE